MRIQVVLFLAGLGGQLYAAQTQHEWRGTSPNNSYWSDYRNWIGDVPSGSTDRVIFPRGAARKNNTNDMASGTSFLDVWIADSGYDIHGSAVRINYLHAAYPSATSSTFRPGILASGDLRIVAETNDSVLNLVGDLTLTDDDLIFPDHSRGNINISGVIAGTGNVYKTFGSGDLALVGEGPNTYNGDTELFSGRVRLDRYNRFGAILLGTVAIPGNLLVRADCRVILQRENQIANASAVTVEGQLDLGGHRETIGSLDGFGTIVLGTDGAFSVGDNDLSTTFDGSIVGAGSVDKIGTGILTLTSLGHSYTGATRVLDGLLQVNGALTTTSSITVSNGGTLCGDGTVSDVLITAGGTLFPGAGTGTASLRATGTVTFAASAKLSVQLASSSSYDSLLVGGELALGFSSLRVIPGAGVRVGDSFTVISKLSSDPIVGTFSGLPEGTKFVVSNRLFQITYTGGNGNDVVLTRLAPPSVSLSIASLPNVQMRVSGRGFAGLIYVLEGTSSLNPPTIWKPLDTNTAAADGAFGFLDESSPSSPRRFYRVWSP
jgi:autotransporter-associated beta strand protein